VVIGVGVNVNSRPQDFAPIAAGLTTLSDCAGAALDLARLQAALARALALSFALPQSVIATRAAHAGLHLEPSEGDAQGLVCVDEAGRRYSLHAEGLVRDWQARDRTGGKSYILRRDGGIQVAAESVDPGSGALICCDASGNRYEVQSYTELESPSL
jgi:biotin-(acetyl-CoA carboxylase) ligase